MQKSEEGAEWVEWGFVWLVLLVFLVVPWYLGMAHLVGLIAAGSG